MIVSSALVRCVSILLIPILIQSCQREQGCCENSHILHFDIIYEALFGIRAGKYLDILAKDLLDIHFRTLIFGVVWHSENFVHNFVPSQKTDPHRDIAFSGGRRFDFHSEWSEVWIIRKGQR